MVKGVDPKRDAQEAKYSVFLPVRNRYSRKIAAVGKTDMRRQVTCRDFPILKI